MTQGFPMLTGYRVLDLTQFVAGPTATRLLAEMGAEVIKLELAPGGDRGRVSGLKPQDPRYAGSSQSTYFCQHNHSKKSVALDFASAHGRELIRGLVREADVLVENFSPGVMARAGLAYPDLSAINPRLIMCSISMAGQEGPLSKLPGFDYMAAAYSGVTAALGEADRAPAQLTVAIGDSYAGISAAMAIGFALLHRERTGEGQYIESTLIDSYFHMQEMNVPRVSLQGAGYVPQRSGALHPTGGPTGIFRVRDDVFIAIMVMPHQWPNFVRALDMPSLLDDPRFATPRARRDNNEELRAVVESWLARFPTRDAALAVLASERVPCAPVLSLNEAMALSHVRERGTVRRMTDRHLGAFDIPGPPVRFSGWSLRTDLRADLLGEHNEAVLRDLLNLPDAEIDRLYAENVLVRDPLLEVAEVDMPAA